MRRTACESEQACYIELVTQPCSLVDSPQSPTIPIGATLDSMYQKGLLSTCEDTGATTIELIIVPTLYKM